MKTIQFFAITAMAAAIFASCSNEGDFVQSNYPSDNIIRVTAGVNSVKSRASERVTPLEENFSLTVVNKNADKYTYVDKMFAKTAGEWRCSETLLWQNATTLVDIAALAPAHEVAFNNIYSENAFQPFDYSIFADQTDKDAKNDLLYYYKAGFNPGEDLSEGGKLDIQFNHAFCMMDIIVTLGTEFNKPAILETTPIHKITIDGTKNTAVVDVTKAANAESDPLVKATGDAVTIIATKGDFTKAADAEKNPVSKFSCILIPQQVAANTFKVILETPGKLYAWTYDQAITFKSGYKYTLNLSMGDDVVLLKEQDIAAESWGDGDTKQVETE